MTEENPIFDTSFKSSQTHDFHSAQTSFWISPETVTYAPATGVIFNDTLTWSNHMDKVYERCAQRVGILRRSRRTFPSRALRRIYVGAVLPIMECACPVWSGGPVAKLIHLHKSFCGVIKQVCHLSRKGLTFTLWYFFTKCEKA